MLILGLKEGLVECVTVCVKSEVILARKDKLINKYYARVNAVLLYIGDGSGCGGWKVRIVIIQGK